MRAYLTKPKAILTAALLAVCAVASAQTVYKVVQEDGTILYTDQPIPGAEPVDLASVNTSVMPRLATPLPLPVDLNDPEGPSYKVNVVSPAPEATIRDNLGRASIVATVAPSTPGNFNLWLNNQQIATQNNGSFSVDGLNRGAHTFFVTVTDNTGKTLASSEPQTFYMHQASVLINAGN